MLEVLAALAPSLFVGLLFWWVIRLMLNGDRREREALAKLDAQETQRPGPSQHRAPEPEPEPQPDREPGPEASDDGVPGPAREPSRGEQDLSGPSPGAGGTGGGR